MMKIAITALLTLSIVGINVSAIDEVSLVNDGKSMLPIVIPASDGNNINTRKTARNLADYFKRISGAEFMIINDPTSKTPAIRLGIAKDFPTYAKLFDTENPFRRDEYLIKTENGSLYLIGATDLALEHAVWDLLYRLGYRQFFPTPTWEIIPRKKNVSMNIDVFEKPDYYIRFIWYGYGSWPENMKSYKDWEIKNRMTQPFRLSTYHVYQRIITENKQTFTEHPEYYGLYKGKRGSHKICVSNPGVQKLALRFAKEFFRKDPKQVMVSMEPSDGDKWCECENCAKLGSYTDRTVFLANYVADGLRKDPEFKHKYVGMLAYNTHSQPPAIKLSPNVIVCVGTAFIHGGYSFEELLGEWHEKGNLFGVRDYYSVSTWDRDMPGAARGSDLDYITKKIVESHAKGARFYNSESGDNWGVCGLGYYIASRLMWDADPAKVKGWTDDFFKKAFGSAENTMRQYYDLTSRKKAELVSDDLIGKMFRLLNQARTEAVGDQRALNRINDLVLYTHYVDLYQKYDATQGKKRQTAFEKMLKFAYRIHDTMMVHSMALYRDVHIRDKQVDVPKKYQWNVRDARNPWQDRTPYTQKEISEMLKKGIKNHSVVEYEKVDYGEKYIPSGAAPKRRGRMARLSGKYQFYIWADTEKLPEINIASGLNSATRGAAKWKLYNTSGKLLQSGEITPDKKKHPLNFTPWGKGLYRFEFDDKGMFSTLTWPKGSKVCLLADAKRKPKLYGSSHFRFYVPKGKKKVVLYMENGGAHVFNAKLRKVLNPTKKRKQVVAIPVKPGDDDQIWNIQSVVGIIVLKNVPPLLALNEDELLIPKQSEKKQGAPK